MDFKYIKNGKLIDGSRINEYPEVMVESQNDLATLSAQGACAVGTIAFTAGYKGMWQRAANGSWVDLYETEG